MYSIQMRVRVEQRRYGGKFIPRYRPQTGLQGELRLVKEEVAGRMVYLLCLYPEQTQYTVQVAPMSEDQDVQAMHRLALFEPRLTYVQENQLRFLGYEATKDRAWVVQEWDCEVLK